MIDAGPERLKVLVYSFADRPVEGVMRVWRLGHGIYRVTTGLDADGDDAADSSATDRQMELLRYSAVPMTLPPGQVTVIEVAQTQPLDDIRSRADLALSSLDTVVEGSVVRGMVHNIGVAAVEATEIVLLNPVGQVIATQRLTDIPGIADDLEAVRVPWELAGLPADATGWHVVVDPDDRVTEICEDNNELTFP